MQDRESYIRFKLEEHYEEIKSLGYEIFALVLQGSQNYNLDIYNEEYWSDIDTKCIILPSLDDIVLNKKPKSYTHERKNKEHIDVKDIRLMFETFRKQNVNFIELLFSYYYIVPDKYKNLWRELRSYGEEIAHAHPAQTLKAMSGMSMEKLKALKHPYPTTVSKIEKYGYDPKQLHHIVRINDFIKRFITENVSFKQAMTPDSEMRDYLIKIKLGKIKLEEAELLANYYDKDSRDIKEKYIDMYGQDIKNPNAYQKLDEIQTKALKQYFKEQLKKDD